MDTPVLWHIPFSHYSEKARWALDYKGIAHRRRVLGSNYLIRVWRATGQGKLPVLWLDGRTIADSTRIIAALEEHYPDLDETLGPALRAAVVTPLFRHDPDTALRMLTTGMGSKAYPGLRPLLRVFPWFYQFRHKISERNLERDRAVVAAALDRIEHTRPRGFHRRRPHGSLAAGAAPAASRDSVPAAAATAAVPGRLPHQAVTASSRAMGSRHLPPTSRTLRGNCQAQMTLSL